MTSSGTKSRSKFISFALLSDVTKSKVGHNFSEEYVNCEVFVEPYSKRPIIEESSSAVKERSECFISYVGCER
uniref:Uncharacterized protein n=1 Tax=Ignisphaera aggregans TaxID=334771 RepID=A0A7J3Z9B0_9CREN